MTQQKWAHDNKNKYIYIWYNSRVRDEILFLYNKSNICTQSFMVLYNIKVKIY